MGVFDTVRSNDRNDRAMGISCPGQFPKGRKSIGHDRAEGGEMLVRPRANGCLEVTPDPGQMEPEGTPLFRALELVRPASLEENLMTWLFGVVSPNSTGETTPFLKLDTIFGHNFLP